MQNSDIAKSYLPKKIYYDIQIANFQSSSTPPPNLVFSENRSTPYVFNSGLYYLSIVRFSLDTVSLPIFTPEITPNQNNYLQTVYSITLSYGNVDIQVNIEWQPQNVSIVPPNPPSENIGGLADNSQKFYDCYSYQWFIDIINNTFATAFAQLQTATQQVELVNGVFITINTLATQNCPFMIWDITTNTAILNCDANGFTTGQEGGIKIYFNSPLYNLFSSYETIYQGIVGIQNGKNNLIIVKDTFSGSNSIQLPINEPTYTAIQVYQEYATNSLWSPIASIVFTSSILPIYKNELSNPQIYYDSVLGNSTSMSSNYSQIITDMIASDFMYKPNLIYVPAGAYRLIDMISNSSLKSIDISVFYKTKLGQLIPFTLNSSCSASIKLLFTLKSSEGE